MQKSTKKVAIVRLWPNQATAEHENIQRIKLALEEINYQLVEIDKNGYHVDSPAKELEYGEVDFVIHLHFETPKCYDSYSYVALWNPVRFYFDWGYQRFSNHLLSHDDFLSCGSTWADDHVRRLLKSNSRENLSQDWIDFNHTLSSPIYSPSLNNPKVFYCGINWERLDSSKGRHHEFLKVLDKKDILRIYGPEKVRNIKVWDGYKTYSGEIPFDGKSLIDSIAKNGISLVFSSEAHIQSGLMSNRLFESIAAGAVVICDDNPFAKENFGDSLLYVRFGKDQVSIAQQIEDHYNWIINNKEKALEMAQAAQKIFMEKYNLELQLRSLIKHHENIIKVKSEELYSQKQNSKIAILIPILEPKIDLIDFSRIAKNIKKQEYKNFEVELIIDNDISKKEEKDVENIFKNFNLKVNFKKLNLRKRDKFITTGELLYQFKDDLANFDLFMFMNINESWFHNHLNVLVKKYENNSDKLVYISDYIYKHFSNNEEFRDCFLSKKHRTIDYNLLGSHLFSTKILSKIDKEYIFYVDKKNTIKYLRNVAGKENIIFSDHVSCIYDISSENEHCMVESDIQEAVVEDSFYTYKDAEFGGKSENFETFKLRFDHFDELSDNDKRRLSILTIKNLPVPKLVWKIMRSFYRRVLK